MTRELSYLRLLEAEAIFVMREVAAEFEPPALLFSGGKDSIVLLRLAEKAFRPARFPFPIMHVNTGHDFPGRLGQSRIKTGIGHIRLDRADKLNLTTGTVDRATGHADITAGSGEVRVRELDSSAVVKNSNGDTWVGLAGGELRVSAANGDIAVDAAQAGVVARSSNGDVRLGEAVRRSVVLETKLGDVEVGIREGTAAWLDVRPAAGRVHNALEAAEAPEPSSETVEVRARTSAGDVVIRRP